MIKKIFEMALVGMFIIVAAIVVLIVVGESFFPRAEYELYTKFLNVSHKNREIYLNEKKVDNVNEILNGLKHVKDTRVSSIKGTKGGCVNIKIMSKNSGMSICIIDSNYHYFYVSFQRFYLKDSGWQPLYISPGTLTKKYLRPYIKEALIQSSKNYTFNDNRLDEEDLLKYKTCERREENGWKLEEGDSNTTKEVCEIILRYFR